MTVQNTGSRKAGPSQGNSVTTVFPFVFKVFAASDIVVTYLNSSGVESTLILGSDYIVTLNADQNLAPGGSITQLWAPAAGTYITITSSVPNTQNLSLTNADGFYPASINDALDRCVIQIQQLAEQLSRTFKLPVSSLGTPGSTVADYLATAAASALSASTSAAAAAVSSAWAATSSISAAAITSFANTQSVANYFDAFPATSMVTFSSIYTPGGWDMGSIVLAAPFLNEQNIRRINLSTDATASFDYGTVP